MAAISTVGWVDAMVYGAMGTLFLQIVTILCYGPSLIQAIREKRAQERLEPGSSTVLGSLFRRPGRVDQSSGAVADMITTAHLAELTLERPTHGAASNQAWTPSRSIRITVVGDKLVVSGDNVVLADEEHIEISATSRDR
jgi:hypothetical protein